ncbi:MAG: hypothetical protein JF589_16890 [Gemmatimonadetes bacterium]|nr:hypothetical protein [Gemmatimonadota bacterium]
MSMCFSIARLAPQGRPTHVDELRSLNWAGQPVTKVWLIERVAFRTVDSLDVRSGTTSYKFATPGAYYYCTGACWDSPDFGLLFIH